MPRAFQKQPDACQLCERTMQLTFHHLIPKKVHRRPHYRKHFSKAVLQEGIWVCRLCHSAIHRQFDEMTLAKRLNSLEAILEESFILRHIEWAKKQRVEPR